MFVKLYHVSDSSVFESRQVKLLFLSLSGYSSLHKPNTNFVAQIWRFLDTAYSRQGKNMEFVRTTLQGHLYLCVERDHLLVIKLGEESRINMLMISLLRADR